ncbi:MAG: SusC/RagA family TonB-linked outer membrane protein [Gracilimonas sp.]|uniref:SusC/RagA family TonB-linked outer membrane protein n=1 Tax=Gracilimonas TaxID=649462 RepID=UPI001B163BA3|nr:SusC/RagA family TonB-linked outer membrane protein [Gracilimonas sp.]MBO6584556.1 SusC/RagA family TonB-linked outer membrane protein [Gracilimonas sp.]MBO6616173.1 SusC/RagA family TonB-linked outer membrane protein [Gracilimonas sp.]
MRNSYYVRFLAVLAVTFFCAQVAIAQYTVSGTVTDASTGEALVGVTIFDANTNTGTSTNINGRYSLELPTGETSLRFSSIGYVTQNLDVSGSNGEEVTLDVEMRSDVANLEELVVTGLASSIKRENLANAITKVDAADLVERTQPQTLDGAFKGKIPGVSIRSQSGAPGGGINVQMRGVSTLGAGSSQPLYIIDGVYVNNDAISNSRYLTTGANSTQEDNSANRLSDINPEDVESIEVLKGPSAAAIYGQRANAGVIIITTKKGQAGDTQVSVSQDVGFNSALNLVGVAEWNPDKITTYTSIFGGNTAAEIAAYNAAANAGRIYDYEEELYGNTGLITQTNVGVSGGNSATSFYITGTTRSEDGIIENTGFDRNSIRLNLDHRISENLRVASRTSYTFSENQRGFTGNQNGTGGSIGYALSYTPTYAQLFPNDQGDYPNNPYFSDNMLSIVNNAVNDQTVQRLIQGLQVNADLFKSGSNIVSLSVDGGVDYLTFKSMVWMPTYLQNQQSNANPGDVVHTIEDNFNSNVQAVLSYATTVSSNIQLNTQLGFSRFDQFQERNVVRGQGLVAGQTGIANATIQSVINQTEVEVVDLSWFGQEEINWDDKIIATVGGRFDRSSLNADQDEYYFYPKASLAINLLNFDIIEGDFLNQLKPRIAYGETGGLPNFGVTYSSLNSGNIGGLLATSVGGRSIDPNLKPESAQELEFGVDVAMLDNRISLEATYYNKKVADLILDEQVPTSSGISVIATNAADLVNKGMEFTLNLNPVRNPNLNWFSTVLFWKNESEITDLSIDGYTTGGFGTSLSNYLIQEGFSPSTIVGLPAVSDPSLYTIYGDGQPDFEMSFSNEFNIYKNFDFSFLWHWKSGGDNINLSQLLTDAGGTSPDWNDSVEGSTLPKGADRVINGGSGAYVYDASYVKLREIGLYYTVPTETLTNIFGNSVSNIKIGASANNVLLFSDYPSYDPETSVFGTQAINNSVEVTPYPTSRQVMFHVNIDF